MSKKPAFFILIWGIWAIVSVCFLFGPAGSALAACPDGMLGYWKLDETSAGAVVDSYGSHNAANFGATINQPGQVETAYRFDGVNDYVTVNDPSFDASGYSEYTVEVWVNPSIIAENTEYEIIGQKRDGSGLFLMLINISGRYTMRWVTTSGSASLSAGTAVAGEWVHLVSTYKANNLVKLYKNGRLVDNESVGVLTTSAYNDITVGIDVRGNAGYAFKGLIDEVAIYSKALTANEVLEHYENGLGNYGYCFGYQHTLEFAEMTSSGLEDGSQVDLEVTLTPAVTTATITVNYAVTDITTDSSDYTVLGTGTLTFAPGVTSQNVSIIIESDLEAEGDEQFKVVLSNLNNGGLDVGLRYFEHVYTIIDDCPKAEFAQVYSNGDEDQANVQLEVVLSKTYSDVVTVHYSINWSLTTADTPDDYILQGTGALTFDPGVTSQNVEITVIDDEDVEDFEEIVVDLFYAVNATLGEKARHRYRISASDTTADWPMWRYDAQRTAAPPHGLASTLYLQWVLELDIPRPAWPSMQTKLHFDASYEPVVMGKKIFVPSMVTDSVTAYDTETGTEQWRFYADGPVRFAPAAASGKVYFVCDDGYLYCVNAEDGALLWKFNGSVANSKILGNKRLVSAWPARGAPVLRDGKIYFGASIWPLMGVFLYALDAESGDVVWANTGEGARYLRMQHGGNSYAGVAPQGYLVATEDILLVPGGRTVPAAYDRDTGEYLYYLIDNRDLGKDQGGYAVAAMKNRFFCGPGAISGSLFNNQPIASYSSTTTPAMYRLSNGDILEITAPSVLANEVVYEAEDGLVKALDFIGTSPDLSELWSIDVDAEGVYCKAGRRIYAGRTGAVIAINENGIKAWEKTIVGAPWTMIAGDDKLFVVTREGYIYCFGETDTGAALPGENERFDEIIGYESYWKYKDTGADQGMVWRELGFNDGSWPQGQAPLGRSKSPRNTTINDRITNYFRKTFTIADSSIYSKLTITVHMDDGAVIYLNGTQVGQKRVGSIRDLNYLTTAYDGDSLDIFEVDTSLLVDGDNLMAVELHQEDPSGNDIIFELKLVGELATTINWPSPDAWTTEAANIIAQTGQDEGYCLVLGAGTARLAEELVRQSELNVIILEPGGDKVEAIRRRWDDVLGVSREHLSIITGDIFSVKMPPYLANLIVSEDIAASGMSVGRGFVEKVFNSLRPYGGKVCLSGDYQSLLNEAAAAYNLANAEVSFSGGYTVLERAGALPDSADWTHSNADAANTMVSKDKLVKAPLGVLWFGGSTSETILPRHGHGPTEQIAGGRLFIEGPDIIRAVDVYTGRVMWEAQLPGIGDHYNSTGKTPSAMNIGSNYVSVSDGVYVAHDRYCVRLDPNDGSVISTFTIAPDNAYIGQIKIYGDLLIVAADPFSFMEPIDVGHDNRHETCSRELIVMDRYTGAIQWQKTADLAFYHNTIIAGEDILYCIDRLPPAEVDALSRRGLNPVDVGATFKLLALDIDNGNEIWSTGSSVFGTWLAYSDEYDVLLQSGRRSDIMPETEPTGRLIVHDCNNNGAVLWNKNWADDGPYLLYHDRIIMQDYPSRSGSAWHLLTGTLCTRANPLTGQSEAWTYFCDVACNYPIGSENLITFRNGGAGYYDISNKGGTGSFGGFRSGCTANLVAADGVLNAPDYSHTCRCSYHNQTSLAFVHMPEVEMWTYKPAQAASGPIKRVGINFGAPGDRLVDNGSLWLDYPSVGGDSPDLSISVSGGPQWFRNHASRFINERAGWVMASGAIGMTEVSIPLGNSSQKEYRVRLYFAEPQDAEVGQRVFDVALQGKPVLADFDIMQQAHSIKRGVVREFRNVKAAASLTVTLTDSVGETVLCGVEAALESMVQPPLVGDFDTDGDVDIDDFQIFGEQWLDTGWSGEGLVAHWALDDNAGNTIVEDSYGDYDGTAQQNTQDLHTDGYFDGALIFSSNGNHVDIPDFDLTSNWTISFWAKGGLEYPAGAAGTMVLGNGDDDNNYFFMVNGNKSRFKNSDGDRINWESDVDFFNRWRFVTLVAGTSSIELFLDGVSQSSQPVDPTFKFYHIGAGHTTDSFDFNGIIDDVMLFNKALPAEEVGQLYSNQCDINVDREVNFLDFAAFADNWFQLTD